MDQTFFKKYKKVLKTMAKLDKWSTSARARFRRYCQWTSLHGFNFLAYPGGGERLRSVFWTLVIGAASAGALFVVGTNISDFADSSVSYDLATPTMPLDGVFFPSLVLCNMNQLRGSFVHALVNDPLLRGRMTFTQVHQLLEKVFVKVSGFI